MIITSPYRCGCAFEVRPSCCLPPLNCCSGCRDVCGNFGCFCIEDFICRNWQCGLNLNNCSSGCQNSYNCHNQQNPCRNNCCDNFQNFDCNNHLGRNQHCRPSCDMPQNCCCKGNTTIENSFFLLAGMLLSQKCLR